MVTEKKWVYKFNEGNAQMRELLGGKGANSATTATRCWFPSAAAHGSPCLA